MSGIEVEDAVAKKREQVEYNKTVTESMLRANMSLVKTFETLTKYAEEAAEDCDFIGVRDALELVQTLTDLGGFDRSDDA